MRRKAFLVALFLTASADPLLPQTVLPLDSGARVRVWSSNPLLTRRAGTFVSLQADTLRINLDRTRRSASDSPGAVALPFSNVTRLDVSRGRHSRARGALIGTVIGLALGAGLGYASASDDGFIDRSNGAAIGGAVVGVVGGLSGGLMRPAEKWERTSLQP